MRTVLTALLLLTGPAFAQAPDFGDDSSVSSRDGICDDARFEGPGLTPFTPREVDIGADAADCRAAFEAGTVTLAAVPAETAPPLPGAPDYGDNSYAGARDGACSDPRFRGYRPPGAAEEEAARLADASDCRAAWESGQMRLR